MIQLKRTATATVDQLLPQAQRAALIAQAARSLRDGLITAGEASPGYRTLVDGRDGAREETIRRGGAIIYRFNTIGQAALYAVTFAMGHSPARRGTYRRNWLVAVNGRPWVGDLNQIPQNSEVIVVNSAPYSRKIDTGHQIGAGRGIAEATRQAVNRQYPNLMAEVGFVELSAQKLGDFDVPYLLRGHQRTSAKRVAAHVAFENERRAKLKKRRIKTVKARRKDTVAGELLTYPAVHIQARLGFG